MSIPFTELPIPRRTKEYVVILKQIDIIDEHHASYCMSMVRNGLCQLTATWQCAICNSWTCDLHEDKEQQFALPDPREPMRYSICESCRKLSKADQRKAYEFQQEMNEG